MGEPELDTDRIDDAVLALLYLGLHGGYRSWKGFDWDAMDRLYAWETTVDVSDLAPGHYTFEAMTSDPSGGEGPGPFTDTRT